MARFNVLELEMLCPRCQTVAPVRAQFNFGYTDLSVYHLGDKLLWYHKRPTQVQQRPKGGNWEGDGYARCENCGRDFWLRITVEEDILTKAEVDPTRPGQMPDRPEDAP